MPGYDWPGDPDRGVISEADGDLPRYEWFRLEVDWRPSGEIVGNIYDENGTLITRVLVPAEAVPTAVTEGGFGFGRTHVPVYFDEVRKATGPAHDVYEFTVEIGETATVALASLTGDPVELELHTNGQLISGAPGAEYVDGYVAEVPPGTYEAHVIGGANAEYSLVVTRNAHFDYGRHSHTYWDCQMRRRWKTLGRSLWVR